MKLLLAVLLASTTVCLAADADLQKQFDANVKPFVGKYCVGCHAGAQPVAQFDLKSFNEIAQVRDDFGRWTLLADRLTAHEMPPKTAKAQPSDPERQGVIDFVHAVRAEEIRRLGGDPGIVLARRLSNAEYDYSIRDLTGQDLQVAREFPVDPANQAGFDNSGESLTMSPALLNKYLHAARQIGDNMVLTADGIDFAPHAMRVETDREKYSIQRIIAFYKAQPTDYADYFRAAWRYKNRVAQGQPNATLAGIAADMHISAKYLPMVWGILHDKGAIGPVAKLQAQFNALPVKGDVDAQTIAMCDWVMRLRINTAMQFYAPAVKGLPGQSEPLHNWRLKQYREHHRDSNPDVLRAANEPGPVSMEVPKYPPLHEDATSRWNVIASNMRVGDNDLVYPVGQKARYQKSFARFASVFPDTFVVSERGRFWPDNTVDAGRLLSAGYHNTGGYYRDDTALMQLILDDKGQKKLNALWDEFDFVGHQTEHTFTQYFFNQSGEVDGNINGSLSSESGSKRPVGHEVTDTWVINWLRDKYLARAAADPHNAKDAPAAIRDYFKIDDDTFRRMEKERTAAEPKHLAALVRFAEHAWRRPLTDKEKADLLANYKDLRATKQLSHEDAIRDSLVYVLMSPDFLYRFDLQGGVKSARPVQVATKKAYDATPLTDYSLANRLSYFLWASMPDAQLLRHAAAGDLHQPKVLLAETRRMLKDNRIKGLATEFTGNWLNFRLFENNNSVDRQRFPAFDDDLREAMFQEPIRFMQDDIQNDRPVTDLLYGNYTFVNPPLAKFYGMPDVKGDLNRWVKVDNAGAYGRGGILPMAVFMTANSPGLRTSPVKRGNWVVQKVLGIRVPPPPPVVPELPSDESKTDLPIREMLAQHHKNPFCAGCHERFDSFGLVFEGYGPVGNARKTDLAGRPVDASATFPGGVNATGIDGLRTFIHDHRQDKFLDNLSRKLLSYALNRSLQLSDESLVEQMQTGLKTDNYRFRAMVEAIVESPQFRDKRVIAQTATADPAAPSTAKPVGGKLIKASFKKAN